MPTALIVTSTITHATPASFFAHVPSRGQMEDIAAFLPNSGVDLFVGGGQNYFDHRKDSCDLLQDFKAKGYNIQEHIELRYSPTGQVRGILRAYTPIRTYSIR